MISPLAIHGGIPAVPTPPPHFTWPPLGRDAATAVLAQLTEAISIPDRSGVIARLEDALQEYLGAKHVVLTSSGTAALHSMFTALGLRPGEEVIAPAYTFFATVTPLLHMGARPVLVDGDETGNVDPAAVEHAITSRTKAVVVTHLWGVPCDMRAFTEITTRHGLALLEDGSHAHGATIGERKVGAFGTASAFSLNGPKPLSAGEGGFAMTDDEETYYRLLLHGHYNKRCRAEIPVENPLAVYAVTGMGLKLRIHPLAATIALNQLSRLDTYLDGRRRIAARMLSMLRGLPGLTVPDIPNHVKPAWYGLCLQYKSEELDGLPIQEFTARYTPKVAPSSTSPAPPARSTSTHSSRTPPRCSPISLSGRVTLPATSPSPNVSTAKPQNTRLVSRQRCSTRRRVCHRHHESGRQLQASAGKGSHRMTPEHCDELLALATAEGIDRLVVGAVIADSGKVLLLRRPVEDFMGGIYELPSGKVEAGESLTDALIREVKEETALTVTGITRYLGSFDYTSGSGSRTRQHNFAVTVQTPLDIVLTEHTHATWTTTADGYPITDAVRHLLIDLR
ncbi:MAG: aminotransferase class I/II-fold pyridoxal phosphate-dependent enzyme [Egibacteraceae bacterium]